MNEQSATSPTRVEISAATTRHRWYVLGLLIVCYGIYNLDKSVISVLIEPLKHSFGMTDTQVGLLTGAASSVPFAIACVPVGVLADRRSRKVLLVVMIAIWSLVTGSAGLASSIPALFLARIGVGAAEAGYTPTAMSLLTDYFPPRLRATALGAFGLGAPLGLFMGMGLGGIVAAHYGWRAAFFIAGLPGLLIAMLLALTVAEPARVAHVDYVGQEKAERGFSAALTAVFRDRALFHVIAGMVLSIMPAAGFAVWLPSFFVRVHGLDLRQAGFASALIFGIFGSAGATLCGILADRVGRDAAHRRLLVPIVGILTAVPVGIIGLLIVPSTMLAILALAPMAFLLQSMVGTGYGLCSSLAPQRVRGTVLSLLLVAINLVSYAVGAQVVGAVSDLTSHAYAAGSISLGLAANFVFALWGAAHFQRARIVLRRSAQDREAQLIGGR